MAIPQQLAFSPTALRGVTAGGVVGNEIGGSGTRGKVLSSAQLKAIVEASGISYLPLSGGTLTGPITGTGGLIEQRDGLAAQCLDIFETYTSGTNNGKLRLKTSSTGHRIVSSRAASGSNRPLLLGQEDSAGAFTGITIATTGLTTIYTPTDVAAGLTLDSASMGYFNFRPTWDGSGVWILGPSSNAYRSRFTGMTEFRVQSGTSRTLTVSEHITFEMTSDTAGNLVYRGSDGTTRRMALTFS